MTERLKSIQCALVSAIEEAMTDLHKADTCELGEVVDMVKDISEAIYYHKITKAMEEDDELMTFEMAERDITKMIDMSAYATPEQKRALAQRLETLMNKIK